MGFKFLNRSESTRNVSTLVIGTGIAQAISLLISPLLTRMYTPADFASLALFTSLVAIAAVLATLRFEYAIVLPEGDLEARNIMRLALSICAVVTFALFAGIAIYDLSVPAEYKSSHFSRLFYLAPLSLLLTALYNVFNFWSTRKKTFLINSRARVTSAIANAGVATGSGILKYTSAGLIFSSITSSLIGVVVTGFEFIRRPSSLFAGTNKKGASAAYLKYKEFAFVNTPHALIDTLQESGLFLLMAYFFDSWIIGLYSFSFRLLKAPAGLLGASLYQVLYQRMSDSKNSGLNMQPMILGVYRRLFLLGIIPAIIGVLFAPDIFAFIFGEKWRASGDIARIILPWIFLNLMTTSLSSLPLIKNKQRQALMISLVDVFLRFTAIIIGGFYHSYILAFTLLSIFCSMTMIFAMTWYYKISYVKNSA